MAFSQSLVQYYLELKKKAPSEKKEQFTNDNRWRLIKSLWAQDQEKYHTDIEQTELFIIFGMSISSVDGWWMSQIYRQLIRENNPAELIIYNYIANERDAVQTKQAFIDSCIYLSDDEKKSEDIAKNKIYVITYGDDNRKNTFLSFPDAKIPLEENRKKILIYDGNEQTTLYDIEHPKNITLQQ